MEEILRQINDQLSSIAFVINRPNIWGVLGFISTIILAFIALFGERIWKWRDRPIIKISYDKNSERCFRVAVVPNDKVQDEPLFGNRNTSRQYYRLRVENVGRLTALKLKVKVELFDTAKHPADRFEPSILNWSGGIDYVNLSPGEDWYADFLSFLTGPQGASNRLRVEIINRTLRGIAWDREVRKWVFKISVFGENVGVGATKFYRFCPSSQYHLAGKLEEVNIK
jgi:hypothetical protein